VTIATDTIQVTVLDVMEDHYSEDTAICVVIFNILKDQYNVDFGQTIEDAEAEAEAEARDEADDTATLDERREEKVREAIEAVLVDYDLSDGRGQTGELYELDGDGMTFMFGTDEEMKEEAIAQVDDLIDQGCISDEQIKDSWARGQSRAEWVAEAVRMDGVGLTLGNYDGNEHDVAIREGDTTTWYMYVRTN
jgi:hypothetical protein